MSRILGGSNRACWPIPKSVFPMIGIPPVDGVFLNDGSLSTTLPHSSLRSAGRRLERRIQGVGNSLLDAAIGSIKLVTWTVFQKLEVSPFLRI